MSNIESNIIDPAGNGPPPPDVIPVIDDPGSDHVGSDDISEPNDVPAIEPDPEEGGRPLPGIRRA
ncbi:hypothetical protein Sa4125_20840 [Aureimonas sp. SA4125]|uniref:hypothetical protein n=1 Tax=Aureimonas sp. SA4125 TaxID=2826993 RepID=UPI001CC5C318|nr:hypothetical protein [Aureimonas sp. SA4125]BDA84542.1 hypothetical protein Sa4125_20840 [Aureimonas sp. SA4125]